MHKLERPSNYDIHTIPGVKYCPGEGGELPRYTFMGYKPTSSKNTLYYPQEKSKTSNTFHTQTISTLIAEWEEREKEMTVSGQEGEEGRIIPRRLSARIQNLADLFERKDVGVMGVSERQPGSLDPEPIIPTFGILGEGGKKTRKVRVVRREGCEGGVRGHPLATTPAKRARDPNYNNQDNCLPDRTKKSRGQPEFR